MNDNQAGVISMIFKYCDDRNLPILDLKAVIKYIQEEGKEDFQRDYEFMHSTSAGTITRAIIGLEQQNAEDIFGEPSFEIEDLMQHKSSGEGVVNVLRLTDMQTKPVLFITFTLCLLAEIFEKCPNWPALLQLVVKPGIVQLFENSLCPLKIFWVSGIDFMVPVVTQPDGFYLAAEIVAVFLCGNCRVCSGLNGVLFSRKSECVVSHRVEHI